MLIFDVQKKRLFEGNTPDYCSADLVVGRVQRRKKMVDGKEVDDLDRDGKPIMDPVPDVPPTSVNEGYIVDPDLSDVRGVPPEYLRPAGGVTKGFRIKLVEQTQAEKNADMIARFGAAGYIDYKGTMVRFTGDNLTKLGYAILTGEFPFTVKDDRRNDVVVSDAGDVIQLEQFLT